MAAFHGDDKKEERNLLSASPFHPEYGPLHAAFTAAPKDGEAGPPQSCGVDIPVRIGKGLEVLGNSRVAQLANRCRLDLADPVLSTSRFLGRPCQRLALIEAAAENILAVRRQGPQSLQHGCVQLIPPYSVLGVRYPVLWVRHGIRQQKIVCARYRVIQ